MDFIARIESLDKARQSIMQTLRDYRDEHYYRRQEKPCVLCATDTTRHKSGVCEGCMEAAALGYQTQLAELTHADKVPIKVGMSLYGIKPANNHMAEPKLQEMLALFAERATRHASERVDPDLKDSNSYASTTLLLSAAQTAAVKSYVAQLKAWIAHEKHEAFMAGQGLLMGLAKGTASPSDYDAVQTKYDNKGA